MDNSKTRPTTIRDIMQSAHFGLGVADARAGRSQPANYESWSVNEQWSYERGRAWATTAPRGLALRRNGEVSDDAMAWYARAVRDIL